MVDKFFFKKTLLKYLDVPEEDVRTYIETNSKQDYTIHRFGENISLTQLMENIYGEYVKKGYQATQKHFETGSMVLKDKENDRRVIVITPLMHKADLSASSIKA